MIAVLLIIIPLLSGLISFFLKDEKTAKGWALVSSIITLIVSLSGVTLYNQAGNLHYDTAWLPLMGSRFTLTLDGMGNMLCLLNSVAMPIIFAATYRNNYRNAASFYGLMLLTQAGMMGVFAAADALLFYFFWELALIPAYFLCSIWGGERRIAVTFKFFIYTFVGSLLMLIGLLYVYFQTGDHSFSLASFYSADLSGSQQTFLFWLMFVAFAIKMPIFPFHTWQPDTYEQAPTAVTMVLSAVMVKMGIFAVIRWLLPVLPLGVDQFAEVVIILSIIGMLYASLIAIKQDDIKRLVAYSSIAHIGLMAAAIFAQEKVGLQGVMIQMFNHGVNVLGLWIVADAIEQKLGSRKFSVLGGLAQKAPVLAILFVVMALANIALPLTNAFIGEFLMFNGLFKYNFWFAAVAGISIILAAVYTLNMIQKVFYGNTTPLTENAGEAKNNVQWMLALLAIVIIVLGVYPQPMLKLTEDTVNTIIAAVR